MVGRSALGVLLDLDGVVHVDDEPVRGAAEAVAWLRGEGIPLRFLTNTTSRPLSAIVERLEAMGVPAAPDQVITPVVAATAWLRGHGIERPALFVPAATATELGSSTGGEDEAGGAVGAVVVGDLGEGWDFATLNRAFRLLMGPARPPLLALGMTRYWRGPDGLRLDAGAFVRALEFASDREAVVLGKPDRAFYDTAVAALGVAPGRVVMVGDDIRVDVGGAQRAGLGGVLVRTGKFSPSDLEGEVSPDAVLDSLADLPRWWQSG